MSYTAESTFRGAALGTQKGWVSVLKRRNADRPEEIAQAYFTNAPKAGLNPDLALAQAALETGWFRSSAWRDRHNPAGIGITGSGAPGQDFGTVEGGVQAHLAHLCCYIYSSATCPIEQSLGWSDPRHNFHLNTPLLGNLKGGQFEWAADPDYISKIVLLVQEAVTSMDLAQDDNTLLEQAWQARQGDLGQKRVAGFLRRSDWGSHVAPGYTVLVSDHGVLLASNNQVIDVTSRCIDDFVTFNEKAGTLVRF